MINLFLTLFYLILLERTSDPDLLGDPGGKAAQLILNGTHCFPNTCAAHLGRRAAAGRSLHRALPTLWQGTSRKTAFDLAYSAFHVQRCFVVQRGRIGVETPQLNKSLCSQP